MIARARRLTRVRFRRAATAGGGPAGRSGAAPNRAGVQPGGDGTGRARAGHPTRARRPTGSSLRRAARAGGGPAGRSGAAPRGAKVKTSGDGSGRGGVQVVARARRLAGPGFKQAAKAGRGGAPRSPARGGACSRRGEAAPRRRGPARLPGPARGPYPLCPVRGGDRAEAGAPCAPPQHPDYIYQRVVSPEAPVSPLRLPGVAKAGPLGRTKATPRPRLCPSRVPAPCFAALRAARTLQHRLDQGVSGPERADPGRDACPGITGVLSRCAGRPASPSPCVFA